MCKGTLRWLNRLDVKDRLYFAPLDGVTAGEWGIDTQDEDSIALIHEGMIYRASEAIRMALAEVGGIGYGIAFFLKMIPLRWREWGYRWIAQRRKTLVTEERCGVLDEGVREKILE